MNVSVHPGAVRAAVLKGNRLAVRSSMSRVLEANTAESILEKADAQVAESIRKLSHATSAMAEAIDEGVGVIKLAVKRSGDLAEEIMDDTTQRVKRHPVETMVTTLAVGLVVGAFIGWLVSRK
jgi:ElaB/YqjD/DUF883 family membrane-anchored ribosome-binding protein